MALVLVADVPALAEREMKALPKTDRASYSDVWSTVEDVLYHCIMPHGSELSVGFNSSAARRENDNSVNFRSPTGWGVLVSKTI